MPFYLFLKNWFSADEFVIVQTSGSTGSPKKLSIKKEFMKNSALATGIFFNVLEGSKALLCLSTDYIAGKMMLIRAISLGWELDVMMPVSRPLESLDKTYDFCAMVPLQLENSLKDLGKVKQLIVGGGVVSLTLKEKLQTIQTNIFAAYGMTETITHVAVEKLNNIKVRPSVYQVLPNINIYKDQRDCLVIEASEVSEELVFTNDIVQLVSDTQFKWLARFDNVINSGGVKLHPEIIEEKFSKIIENRFFVAGIPDSILGQKMVLVIEGDKQDSVFKKVSNISSLSKFETPKEVYFIDEFVETETGKIQRKKTLKKIIK